jgi:hypothetical protein
MREETTISGTTYTLTQQPYLAGTHETPVMRAMAENGDEQVVIEWDIDMGVDEPEAFGVDWNSGRIVER